MLRRAQPIALKDNDTEDEFRAENERPLLRRNLSSLRAADEPDAEAAPQPEPPPQPTRFDFDRVAPPSPERRSLDALRTEFQRSLMAPAEDGETETWKPRFNFGALRISRAMLLVVALLAGGVAAWLALQPHEPPATVVAAPVEEVKPPPTVQVLIAKAAIGAGQRLSPGALEWQDWPVANLQPQYITSADKPDALDEMTNSAARFAIFPGEPIREDKLGPAGKGYLSAMLDSGLRGVSVSVSAESASGGFIVPNDHVDVVLTRSSDTSQSSETILNDVRVLAIDTHVAETEAAQSGNGSDPATTAFADHAIATLALDPTQAEVIINATGIGRLSLMLRPSSDAATNPDTAAERATNAAIRLSSPFWAR